MEKKYKSLKDFYPYYLTEHRNDTSRYLHFIGTCFAVLLLLYGLFSGRFWFCLGAVFCGYFFAWIGHFFFEKNRPATFVYPGLSLASDFIMAWDIITGQLPSKMKSAKEKFGIVE